MNRESLVDALSVTLRTRSFSRFPAVRTTLSLSSGSAKLPKGGSAETTGSSKISVTIWSSKPWMVLRSIPVSLRGAEGTPSLTAYPHCTQTPKNQASRSAPTLWQARRVSKTTPRRTASKGPKKKASGAVLVLIAILVDPFFLMEVTVENRSFSCAAVEC